MATTWADTRDVEESDLQLGEEIGSGGQGRVLRVHGTSAGTAYKRYKSAGADPGALKMLVDLPASLRPVEREHLLRQSAWPLARVVQQGKVTGFLMQEIPDRFYGRNSVGASKRRELQYLLYERKPAWGDITAGDVSAKTRVRIAREFAGLVRLLHDSSLVIGDISMTNVLWTAGDTPSVFLIDCDGIRRLGSPPVLRQVDSPDWTDPDPPVGGPDLDTDRYKLALLVGRVLCKASYIRPGDELQPVPDLPGDISLRVQELWARAAGPRTSRPDASDWVTALADDAWAAALRSADAGSGRPRKGAPGKGRMLGGRYRLVRQLAGGSFGSVWEAHDTLLERTVAIKELDRTSTSEDPAIRRERMRREALALARIEHPAIATVHDLISDGQDLWLVMAYVPGQPLHSAISDSGALDEQEVARIGLAVLDALTACHAHRVYHRDVKPANILLGGNGTVHLVDFGIARIADMPRLTPANTVVGTPEFLAPELLCDESPGPGTDLWALAVTLYYALTGRSPFRAETLEATIAAILSKTPEAPRARGEVADLLLTMLRKNPAERPDAASVAAVLREVTDGGRAAQAQLPGTRQARSDPPQIREEGRAQQTPDAAWQSRPLLALTALSEMPDVDAARMVGVWSPDQAAAELLALGVTRAAHIINRCDDPVAGKLLSGIAVDQPAQAWKILRMLSAARAGRLLDHMSSPASASALSHLAPGEALRVLDHADDLSAISALSLMSPPHAASLLMAMDIKRAGELLARAAPATAADLLRHVTPASRRQALIDILPGAFGSLVTRHL